MDTVTILGTTFSSTILLVIGLGALFLAGILAKISNLKLGDPSASIGKPQTQTMTAEYNKEREELATKSIEELSDRVTELETALRLAPSKKPVKKKKREETKNDKSNTKEPKKQ